MNIEKLKDELGDNLRNKDFCEDDIDTVLESFDCAFMSVFGKELGIKSVQRTWDFSPGRWTIRDSEDKIIDKRKKKVK